MERFLFPKGDLLRQIRLPPAISKRGRFTESSRLVGVIPDRRKRFPQQVSDTSVDGTKRHAGVFHHR